MKKYALGVTVLVAIIAITLSSYFIPIDKTPKSLDPPLLKTLKKDYGATVQLTGTAYPGAKVLIFVDGSYVNDVLVDSTGAFNKTIQFDSDGIKKLSLKQIYKNVSSNSGAESSINIDVTPPDTNLFSMTTEIPDLLTEKAILLSGSASPNEFVVINGKNYEANPDGIFQVNYNLQEGENELKFSMADKFGNSTKIIETRKVTVDTIPPKISSFIAPSSLSATEESVVIDIGNWEGYLDSYNSVALTGSVKGNVASITVDGKQITWDENNNIYQRVNLFIYGGLNKYKVVVTDWAGNTSTGYVQTTAERTNDSIDVNLNEF